MEETKWRIEGTIKKYISSSAIASMAYKSLFRILALIYQQHLRVGSLNASQSVAHDE
jgi:hypothetical protein